MEWLFEAKKRYGLSILNMSTSIVHLLISDNCERDTIPKSIQLIAGRTGQEYNQRKNRKGAFWEDRYHETAVALDEHLFKRMVRCPDIQKYSLTESTKEKYSYLEHNTVLIRCSSRYFSKWRRTLDYRNLK